MTNFPIDFVVTWVDGNDPKWQEKKNQFSNTAGTKTKGMSSAKAYRDWGTFRFWFRGVECFAPWVNHVYLVTDNQIPEWLSLNSAKLSVIDHSEIIPTTSLPTFNSNAIEANVHRIKGLAEHFVVFNDDMYLTAPTKPTDFFSAEGLPRYNTALSPIIAERYGTGNFQVNDMEIITDHFSRNQILKQAKLLDRHQGKRNLIKTLLYRNSKFICGFWESHLPYPFLKTTIEKIWHLEPGALEKTSQSRFRSKTDTNLWLFKYWQIASGQYEVGNPKLGKLVSLDDAGPVLWKMITSGEYPILCINDGFNVENEDVVMANFINSFEKVFPKKSQYEK